MDQKLKRGTMKVLASSMIEGSKNDFAAAIHVLISKPNSVNKTLIGAEIMKLKLHNIFIFLPYKSFFKENHFDDL